LSITGFRKNLIGYFGEPGSGRGIEEKFGMGEN
jgi:hypothetical protein